MIGEAAGPTKAEVGAPPSSRKAAGVWTCPEAGSGVAGGIGETLMTLSYSRDAEHEADLAGIGLLQEAGLWADGLGRFFERFGGGAEMPGALSLLSTHPSSESRAELARRAGTAGAPAMSEVDWQALKVICGPKEKEGSDEADGADETAS